MEGKLRVGVLFGGKSGEHEVSLLSASSILNALADGPYELVPMSIDRLGQFHWGDESLRMLGGQVAERLRLAVSEPDGVNSSAVLLVPGVQHDLARSVDVVIPALHGPYGEDGTVQGLLEMAGIPYVGSGVLASAVGMDKVMAKQVFAQNRLPQVEYRWFTRSDWRRDPDGVVRTCEGLGYPCFVKPANMGSSVGVTRAADESSLREGIALAAEYDRRIIVERGLHARELEVGVLGWDDPRTSVVGEVIPSREFYDYDAKYGDGQTDLVIPADLPKDLSDRLRDLATRAFRALDCSGLARVDFFLDRKSGDVYVNELNTMPGFTPYSMYPQLWRETGVSYGELLRTLIELGLERHRDRLGNRV